MSDAYVFYCSKCKVDHAGECPPSFFGDPTPEQLTGHLVGGGRDVIEGLANLIKALEAGSYNAAPSTLHQCKYDGSCGCWKVSPTDPGVVTRSFTLKLAEPLKFIPLYFYLDGV
jgi:hypothetical protein